MAAVFDYSGFILGNMIYLIGTLDALHRVAFKGMAYYVGWPRRKDVL